MSKPQVLICGDLVWAHAEVEDLRSRFDFLVRVPLAAPPPCPARFVKRSKRTEVSEVARISIRRQGPSFSTGARARASTPTYPPFTAPTVPRTRSGCLTRSSSGACPSRSSGSVTMVQTPVLGICDCLMVLIISRAGAGYDQIDIQAATARGRSCTVHLFVCRVFLSKVRLTLQAFRYLIHLTVSMTPRRQQQPFS
jgi:hypothetical protein